MSAGHITKTVPWRQRARQFVDKAVNFILPSVCVSCGQVGDLFCESCQKSLTWFSAPLCPSCGRPLPFAAARCSWCRLESLPLDEIRAVCAFDGAAKDAIHALKFDGMFAVAEPLAQLMAQRFPAWSQPCDFLIPIPLHPERVRERGYNQANLLVRHLCRQLDAERDEDALWRTRPTRPQVGLDRVQRRQNVQGAFATDRQRVAGRHILLVDDVCTSGATLSAAAKALLDEGAASVRGFCFARPVMGRTGNQVD